MIVCTKFRGNLSLMILVFASENRLQVWRKTSLIQKQLKYGKKYFKWLCLKIPFHSCRPTFGHNEFFFLPFFSSKSCTLSPISGVHQNLFLFEVVELQSQFFD